MPIINIVLVEPQIPQNTGNVARTCAVTGARLHLVGPMGFAVDDKKLKRAGLDYWHHLDITYYQSLTDFFEKNQGPYFYFTSKGPRRHVDAVYPDGSYLVFGREDAGLPEALLAAHPKSCVRMPMRRGEGFIISYFPVEIKLICYLLRSETLSHPSCKRNRNYI